MATTEITVQDIVRTGLEATYAAASSGDGDVFDNAQHNVFLHVINANASDTTVTIDMPLDIDGLNLPDLTVVVTASEERFIGPFPAIYDQYDADNDIGKAVVITYSITASVTVAALRMPDAIAT